MTYDEAITKLAQAVMDKITSLTAGITVTTTSDAATIINNDIVQAAIIIEGLRAKIEEIRAAIAVVTASADDPVLMDDGVTLQAKADWLTDHEAQIVAWEAMISDLG